MILANFPLSICYPLNYLSVDFFLHAQTDVVSVEAQGDLVTSAHPAADGVLPARGDARRCGLRNLLNLSVRQAAVNRYASHPLAEARLRSAQRGQQQRDAYQQPSPVRHVPPFLVVWFCLHCSAAPPKCHAHDVYIRPISRSKRVHLPYIALFSAKTQKNRPRRDDSCEQVFSFLILAETRESGQC